MTILNEISFAVVEGETIAILGSSGSGKSTFLKIIAGLITAQRGQVSFNERPIEHLKQQGSLSYMFQNPCLMPNLTVRQNIEFTSRMLGKSFEKNNMEIIKMVGLQSAVNKLPKELSGGMQTRTALARSFISQPSLLLLDEAFSGLDQGWRYDLYYELRALQKRDNTTIVVVTHDIDEALELADRIFFLDNSGYLRNCFENDAGQKLVIREKLIEIIKEDHLKHLQVHA